MKITERLGLFVSHAEALAIERDALRALAIEQGGASVGLDPQTLDRDVAGLLVGLGLGDVFRADVARGVRPVDARDFVRRWTLALDTGAPRVRRQPLRPLLHDGNPATPGQKVVRGRTKPRALPKEARPIRSAPTLITIEEAETNDSA